MCELCYDKIIVICFFFTRYAIRRDGFEEFIYDNLQGKIFAG